jgi:RNA polymerase sigma-70 factor, ECF subfamily
MDSTEHDTFRAAIHGDRDAFEMIIRTHSRVLFAIAYGVLQNREEAEDVVQDTLVKAWKTRWRVRDPEKFPAWLSTIARHRACDVARRRRTVPFSSETEESIDPSLESATVHPRGTEVTEQVRAALLTLPELHRAALTLRYFEEMDYAAIERALGLTNGALRGILGRAMSTMRKRLGRRSSPWTSSHA